MKKLFLLILVSISLASSAIIDDSLKAPLEVENNKVKTSLKDIKNIHGKGGIEKAKIAYTITNNAIDSILLKYTTKVQTKRKNNAVWIYKTVSANTYSTNLEELKGGEKYVFKLGYSKTGKLNDAKKNKDNFIWTKKGKFKTERSWGIFKLLVLIGSLGLFIFGMKMMSDGLQKAAGSF